MPPPPRSGRPWGDRYGAVVGVQSLRLVNRRQSDLDLVLRRAGADPFGDFWGPSGGRGRKPRERSWSVLPVISRDQHSCRRGRSTVPKDPRLAVPGASPAPDPSRSRSVGVAAVTPSGQVTGRMQGPGAGGGECGHRPREGCGRPQTDPSTRRGRARTRRLRSSPTGVRWAMVPRARSAGVSRAVPRIEVPQRGAQTPPWQGRRGRRKSGPRQDAKASRWPTRTNPGRRRSRCPATTRSPAGKVGV